MMAVGLLNNMMMKVVKFFVTTFLMLTAQQHQLFPNS